jgi:DNA-binding XRE family transcriptional regulator
MSGALKSEARKWHRRPMKPTPKPAPDALELLHQTLYAGHPDRLAGLEQARLEDELGRRVRSLREAAGLTQAQLARRLGVVPRFVADLEEAAIETNYLLWLQRVAAVVSKRVQIRCAASCRRREGRLQKDPEQVLTIDTTAIPPGFAAVFGVAHSAVGNIGPTAHL